MASPWSTAVAAGPGATVLLHVMLTLDPGPCREFRPYLTVELDADHASRLVGQLVLALQDLRAGRAPVPDNVVAVDFGNRQ